MIGESPFRLATAIDFSDDCQSIAWTPTMLERLIDGLARIGTTRVHWGYDQPGQWDVMARYRPTAHTLETTAAFGGYPGLMATAARLVRERGMEFVAFIRPYEVGVSSTVPDRVRGSELPRLGGYGASVDPWIEANPHLRLRAWMGDVPPDLDARLVGRIQLRSIDPGPDGIGPADVHLWTSEDNLRYVRSDATFEVRRSSVTSPTEIRGILGDVLAPAGAQLSTIELVGLRLHAPYVAITTSLRGSATDVRNTAVEMVRVFDTDDRPLPIVVASHKSTWDRPRAFPESSLEFDGGTGDFLVRLDVDHRRVECRDCRARGWTDCMMLPLYPDEPECRDGVIAFALGRNEHAVGQPCEAYPDVQAEWSRWVEACVAAGAEAVDVRISNHSGWTDRPELLGYNEPVLDAFRRATGREPLHPDDEAALAALRGRGYTAFLQRLKARLRQAGVRLFHHLEVESWRPDAPLARRRTQAGALDFAWREWLDEGLLDEATLMGVAWAPDRVLTDPLAREMSERARAAGIPVHLRQHMFNSQDPATHADRMEAAFRSRVVDGYIYYDSACLIDRFHQPRPGEFTFLPGMIELLADRARRLGITPAR